jgi:hypothetical protein
MMTWKKRTEHPFATAFLIGMGTLVVALGMMAAAILLLQGLMVGR